MKNLISKLKKMFFSKDEILDEDQQDILSEPSEKTKNIHNAATDFYSACKKLNEEFEHRVAVENEVEGTMLLFAQEKIGPFSNVIKKLWDTTENLNTNMDIGGELPIKKSSRLRK